MLFVVDGVELIMPKLLDDEEFDFDLPVSPVDSEQCVLHFYSILGRLFRVDLIMPSPPPFKMGAGK